MCSFPFLIKVYREIFIDILLKLLVLVLIFIPKIVYATPMDCFPTNISIFVCEKNFEADV